MNFSVFSISKKHIIVLQEPAGGEHGRVHETRFRWEKETLSVSCLKLLPPLDAIPSHRVIWRPRARIRSLRARPLAHPSKRCSFAKPLRSFAVKKEKFSTSRWPTATQLPRKWNVEFRRHSSKLPPIYYSELSNVVLSTRLFIINTKTPGRSR